MPPHPWWLLCLAAFVYATLVALLIISGYTIIAIWKWIHAPYVTARPDASSRRAAAEDCSSKRNHAA